MNLYLSRLLLNPHSRQVISELAHPYEMHRTIMRAFPKVSDENTANARETHGVLFRADTEGSHGVVKVYVQSRTEPDWSFLDELSGYVNTDRESIGYSYKSILPVYQMIHAGQQLNFRLRANPAKRIAKKDDPMKGKRVGLLHEEEQIDWLIRKGRERTAPGGFELVMKEVIDSNGSVTRIPRVTVSREGLYTNRKKSVSSTMQHNSVRFDGVMQITDEDAFREALICGIGPAKAFGFGLLSVAPL